MYKNQKKKKKKWTELIIQYSKTRQLQRTTPASLLGPAVTMLCNQTQKINNKQTWIL